MPKCIFCGERDTVVDGTCSVQECQALLHRSYGDEAFAEFCEREGMAIEDWDEFFADLDKVAIDNLIKSESHKAKHALLSLIEVLKDEEHSLAHSLIELRGLRSYRGKLEEALKVVEEVSKYRMKEV